MSSQPIRSLIEVLAELTDFRQAKGKRHELILVLTVILLGLLCQQNSMRQIAAWAQALDYPSKKRLRFRHGQAPSLGTIRRVLMHIDLDELTHTFESWFAEILDAYFPPTEQEAWALDAKTLRNSLDRAKGQGALQMLNLLVHHLGLLVTSQAIPAGVGETTQGRQALENLIWSGKIITADAAHTKRPTAEVVSKKGGICSCA